MSPDDRLIKQPFTLDELRTMPERPKSLRLSDLVTQSISALTGMFYGHRRFVKVDHGDRILACNSGQEANRVTETRMLAVALPLTIVLQPDMVAWAVTTTAGGVNVDPQDAAFVSYGLFTIPNQGVWEMHIPCAAVQFTTCAWSAAAATHITLIQWRRA